MKQAVQFLKNAPLLFDTWKRVSRELPIGFSFNLSDRCPIGCDCYWRAQGRVTEMSDEAVITFFKTKRDEGFQHVTIVGGEPYVRPKLLERVTPIIRSSWVVTSGTTPLLALPHTTHFISIDGADAETHNAIRKSKGLFERILQHLAAARSGATFPAYIHSVLNAKNYLQIERLLRVWKVERLLRVWKENELVDGVLFSTMTPIKQSGDASLRLQPPERIWIVRELHRVEKIFGKFLCMSPQMIAALHPDRTATQTPENCATAQRILSYDASGARIQQCILSEKADCSECGCVITSMVDTFAGKSWYGIVQNSLLLSKLIQNE